MGLANLALLGDARFGGDGRHAVVLGPALAKAWGSGMARNSGYALDVLFADGTLGVSLEVARLDSRARAARRRDLENPAA